MTIIAIIGEERGPGVEIAREVANRLGCKYLGDDFLQETAVTYGTTVARLSRAMGQRSFLDRVTYEGGKSIVYIKAALARLLSEDNLVFHGLAMHLIPSRISHVLKVGIASEPDARAQRIVGKAGIDPDQAAREIAKADADIATWIKQLFGVGRWDASLYDIKIPVPETSLDDAVQLICDNSAKEALLPTEKSVQALRDFLLSTQVNLLLAESGYEYCEVTAEGDKVTVEIDKKQMSGGPFIRAISALRYDQAVKEVKRICLDYKGVSNVKTIPGPGYKKPSRALLVDDEEDYVLTLSERLESREIPTAVVHNGEQALNAVSIEEPEVMVLDLRMPGIDGIEVLRRVKRDHPNMEVIILTGHGCEDDVRIAKELGAFAFLTKPVDIDVLTETMKQAYNKVNSSAGDHS